MGDIIHDDTKYYKKGRNRIIKKAFLRERVEFWKKLNIVTIGIAILVSGGFILSIPAVHGYYEADPLKPYDGPLCDLTSVDCESENITVIMATVTGYNTVPWQTDDTPCIAASGDNICGRDDVVACPRHIPLGTDVEIDGKQYICLDRLAKKYDHRFDISCDKDMECPAKVSGTKAVKVKNYNANN